MSYKTALDVGVGGRWLDVRGKYCIVYIRVLDIESGISYVDNGKGGRVGHVQSVE